MEGWRLARDVADDDAAQRALIHRSRGAVRESIPRVILQVPCSPGHRVQAYTEWMVLGAVAVAVRVPGVKLMWDPKKLEFTNNREANRYVKPAFRKGWELRSIT